MDFLNKYSSDNKKVKILLLIICAVLYGNSIFNKYALDDDLVVTENQLVLGGIKNLGKIFVSHYSNKGNQSYEYRPVVVASFAIEHQIFGSNPHVSHLVSVLLYWLILYLLFIFLKELMVNYHPSVALLTTLIFAILPVHTEVVDNIKCRDELLSLLFMLLSALQVLKHTNTGLIKHLGLAFLYAFIAIASKVSTVPLLILTPLLIWYFNSKTSFKKILQVMFLLLLSYGILILIKKLIFTVPNIRDFKYFENPMFLVKYSFLEKIPMMLYSYGFYIKLLIIPFPLLYYYGYNQIPIAGYDNIWIYLVLAGGLFLVYKFIKEYKNKPMWLAAALFFIIATFPFTNLISPAPGIIAERFIFASSIGFAMFATPFIMELQNGVLIEKRKTILYLWLLISVIIILKRNADWKDIETLYNADIEYLDNSAKAHSLLAITNVTQIKKTNNMQEKVNFANAAIKHFSRAIEIYPNYTVCINNLGSVYFNYFNEYNKAKPLFKRAIELDTNYNEAYFNLAYSYEKLNQSDSAIYYYKLLGTRNPDHQQGLINLTRLLVNANNSNEAIRYNLALSKKYPDKITPWVNLANINLVNHDSLSALPYLEAAYKIDPANSQIAQFIQLIKTSPTLNGK